MNETLQEIERLVRADPQEAIARAPALIAQAKEAGEETIALKALHALATAYYNAGELATATIYFAEGIQEAKRLGNTDEEFAFLHGQGLAAWHSGEYAEALDAMYRAMAYRRETGNIPYLITSLNSLGGLNGSLGNYDAASEHLTEALRLIQETGNERDTGPILNNLGLLRHKLGDSDSACEMLERGVAIAEKHNYPALAISGLYNLADIAVGRGQYELAWQYARQLLRHAGRIKNRGSRAMGFSLIGDIAFAQGRPELAAKAQAKAIALDTEAPEYYQTQRALALQAMGDTKAALELLTEVLEETERKDVPEGRSRTHEALWKLHEVRGEFADALKHCEAHFVAERDTERQAAQNILTAQMARLEVEKAEREIEIERLRNVELAEAYRTQERLLNTVQEQARKLEKLAIEDGLTGLYNRRHLNDFLPGEIERSKRYEVPLSISLADIDFFKKVNDTFGHGIGDVVLKTVARLYRENSRTVDTAFRYGGEEFVLVMPETSPVDAHVVMERIRLAIEVFDWKTVHPDLKITISIGISDKADEGTEKMLMQADMLLYEAKRTGKNRICL